MHGVQVQACSNPSHGHVGAVDGRAAQPGSQEPARQGPRRRNSLLQLVLMETAAASTGAGASAAGGRKGPGEGGSGGSKGTAAAAPPERWRRSLLRAASELPASLLKSAPAVGGVGVDDGREEGFAELLPRLGWRAAAPQRTWRRRAAAASAAAPSCPGCWRQAAALAAVVVVLLLCGGLAESFVGSSGRSFTRGDASGGPGGRGGAGEGGRAGRHGGMLQGGGTALSRSC